MITTIQFHTLGVLNPLVSILSGGGTAAGSGVVPFQVFGLAALVILFVMAATSHDFWQSRLSAETWKRLHVGVYAAYVLLVAHVAFGIGHQAGSEVWLAFTGAGALLLGGLHAAAWIRDRSPRPSLTDGWVRAGPAATIPDGRAVEVLVEGAPVAVFRSGNTLSAVSGVCRHQGGPLAEGRILNGCIVCPWHGYEYDAATGCAPDPFNEKLPTFNLRLQDGQVYVASTPNPPGTPVDPLPFA